MRVIAGRARGSKLVGPSGQETRPTSDRIKESLFNMIGFELYDKSFLDLYSGSGAIGIEALSRGAKDATFVESSREANKAISSNINKTRFNEDSTILNMDIYKALDRLGKENKKFNIIFMDPPYNKDLINNTLQAIIDNKLLDPEGFIIIEKPKDYKLKDYKELKIWKEKDYKITTMIFLKGV